MFCRLWLQANYSVYQHVSFRQHSPGFVEQTLANVAENCKKPKCVQKSCLWSVRLLWRLQSSLLCPPGKVSLHQVSTCYCLTAINSHGQGTSGKAQNKPSCLRNLGAALDYASYQSLHLVSTSQNKKAFSHIFGFQPEMKCTLLKKPFGSFYPWILMGAGAGGWGKF